MFVYSDQAAKLLLKSISESCAANWNNMIQEINSFIPETPIDEENGNIYIEFILASIAVESRAILNISFGKYPLLMIHIFEILRDLEGFGEDAVEKIQQGYLPAMRDEENNGLPFFEGTLRVLFKSIGLEKDPIIGMAIMSALVSISGCWKQIHEEYKIV